MFGVTRTSLIAAIAAGAILGLGVHPQATFAQGQTGAVMRVGATVAPRCTITVDDMAATEDRSPLVRVVCSRSGLRNLRVTTSGGEGLAPITTFAGSQLRAGGEVVFVVPVAMAAVASRVPVTATVKPVDRRPVTVTLDF